MTGANDMNPDIIEIKARERQAAHRRRTRAWNSWQARGGDAAGQALARLAPQILALTNTPGAEGAARVASAYLPMRTEIDPLPLLAALGAGGASTCLPVVAARAAPLQFRAWSVGDPTEPAGFGTREPAPSLPPVRPDLLLVPLLAFDRTGYRLGYGGGYYDRTLRSLRDRGRVWAIGVAFDEQEIDAVPHLDYDERLDAVATPGGLRRFTGS